MHKLSREEFRQEIEFAGYNVPHPLEDKILVRLQTKEGVIAGDVLLQALKDLDAIFKSIKERFVEAYDEFKSG